MPYCIDTDNIQTVREAYFKVRLLHAKAKHIVCAYNLPAAASKQHLYQDYCDDGDHGVGAILLEAMKKSKVTHKAYFIVRHCGKDKLNKERFTAYLKAAQQLTLSKPKNIFLGIEQALDVEPVTGPEKQQSGSSGFRAISNRGRGRGRPPQTNREGSYESMRGRKVTSQSRSYAGIVKSPKNYGQEHVD